MQLRIAAESSVTPSPTAPKFRTFKTVGKPLTPFVEGRTPESNTASAPNELVPVPPLATGTTPLKLIAGIFVKFAPEIGGKAAGNRLSGRVPFSWLAGN